MSTVLSKIVLEKDSGKHHTIMIEPVDCHLYKILHPERTALHCLGWKKLNVFFFWNEVPVVNAVAYIFYWCLRVRSDASAPNTHYVKRHECLTATRRSSAPANGSIIYIKDGVVNERESEVLPVRRKIFNFNFHIPQEQTAAPSCPICHTKLILDEGDDRSVNFVTVYDG